MFLKGKIFGYRIGFSLMREKKNEIFGYTNRCDDGKFIVFLDYDCIEYGWLYREIKALQNDFNLGHFYIFKSSEDNYHAISFTKVTLIELKTILMNTSMDENYYRVPFSIGKKLLTLRITEKEGNKPKFLAVIKNGCGRLESFEHKQLINKLFNCIPDKCLSNGNDLEHPTKLIISNYQI